MKKLSKILMLSVLALFLVAGSAMALPINPRPVLGLTNLGDLQTFLNANDTGIDVYNDQNGAALWATSPSGNSTFTIKLEAAGWAGTNKVGLYNDGDTSTLFEIFAGVANPGDYATVSFNYLGVPGDILVTYVDYQTATSTMTQYSGVNSSGFGFYLDASGAGELNSLLYFSEDDENLSNTAQNLVYQSPTGTGWWICFEDQARWVDADSDFTDFVLFAESVRPIPEPATMLLLGTGLIGLAGFTRRRFKK